MLERHASPPHGDEVHGVADPYIGLQVPSEKLLQEGLEGLNTF